MEQLEAAHIACTHEIMENLQREYEDDHKKTEALPKQNDQYSDYESAIQDLTALFQQEMLKLNQEKNHQIKCFEKAVRATEAYSETESINLITEFNKKKKVAMRLFLEADDETEEFHIAEEGLQDVKNSTHDLEEKLFDIELALVERLTEALDEFAGQLNTKVKAVRDRVGVYVEEFKEKSAEYFGAIEIIAKEQLDKYHGENANQEAFKDELRKILKEKDIITNAISNLKEEHAGKIFEIETVITEAYDNRKEEFIEDFKKSQHLRNRKRCGEIMDVMETARQEIDDAINADYEV